MSGLCQAVHYYPDGVITGSSARQDDYKVHSNLIPFPFEESAMAVTNLWAFDALLNSLTTVTYGHILCDLTIYTVLLESFIQVLVHLLAARMYGINCLMSFLKNQLPNRSDVRNTKPIFEPYHIFRVFPEIFAFSI
jgi:hypothetical protein